MLSSSVLRSAAAAAAATCIRRAVLLPTTAPSFPGTCHVRPYVMWPPEFEDPVPHRSNFQELRESGEYQRKRLVPVKAAENEASASVFYDPLVLKVHLLTNSQIKVKLRNFTFPK